MRKISNTQLWAFIFFFVLLFAPTYALVNREVLFEVLNAVGMAVAAGVAWTQRKSAWRILRAPAHLINASDVLIVSIAIGSIGLMVLLGNLWLWRATGGEVFINGVVAAFARWTLVCSYAGVLLTSGSQDNRIELASYRRTGVLIALAIMVVALVISFFGIG